MVYESGLIFTPTKLCLQQLHAHLLQKLDDVIFFLSLFYLFVTVFITFCFTFIAPSWTFFVFFCSLLRLLVFCHVMFENVEKFRKCEKSGRPRDFENSGYFSFKGFKEFKDVKNEGLQEGFYRNSIDFSDY